MVEPNLKLSCSALVRFDENLEGAFFGTVNAVCDSLRQEDETFVTNLLERAFADADVGWGLGLGLLLVGLRRLRKISALLDSGLCGFLACRRNCA